MSVVTLREAQREGRSALVVIAGEAGIGKTSVLRTAMEQAARMGFAVGYGSAGEVAPITPGAPLLTALRSGSTPLLDGTTFSSLAPLQAQPLWLVDEIVGALDKIAHQSPALIVLDDMQWADQLTGLAIRLLPGRLADAPIVWLLSTRAATRGFLNGLTQSHAEGVTVEVVELEPLADHDLDAIARDVLGGAPDGMLLKRLHDVGGSPLLAVQLLEGATRSGAALDRADDIPESVVDGIHQRLAQLSQPARELLRVMAVWGKPLSIEDATLLVSITPPAHELLASVEDLVATGMVWEKDDFVSFGHDVVREAVYAGIPSATRRALHRRCMRRLVANGAGAVAAAPHARAALVPGGEKEIEVLRQAACDCRSTTPDVAGELIRAAFDALPVEHPLRRDVGEQCADILAEAQHGGQALAVVDELLADDCDADTEARLQVIAARAFSSMGLLGDTVRRVEDALGRTGLSEPLRIRLTAADALARTRIADSRTAHRAAQAALVRAELVGDKPAEVIALQALGEIAKNEARHQAAYDHFHQLRLCVGNAFLAQEVAELQLLERFDEAQTLLLAAEPVNESASPPLLNAALWQDFLLGRYDQAAAQAHALIRLSNERGSPTSCLDAWQILSRIAALAGDFPTARAMLGNIEDIGGDESDPRLDGARLIMGHLSAFEGDPVAAVEIVKPLVSEAASAGRFWPRCQEWVMLNAKMAVAAGDPQFAAAAATHADRASERNPGVAGYEGVSLHVRGYLAGDASLLAESVSILRGCPRPQLLGYALADHGVALTADGRREGAIESLDEAWTIFDRIGHGHDKAGVQHRLYGLGVRRRQWKTGSRRRPPTGLPALTTTESVVARLVSQGMSNRAAAAHLGVSVNTVGAHLRSVFAKLDVQSRVQLANVWNGHRDDT